MDSSFSPKDEIWFLRVCHHISNAVYKVRSMWTLSLTAKTVTSSETVYSWFVASHSTVTCHWLYTFEMFDTEPTVDSADNWASSCFFCRSTGRRLSIRDFLRYENEFNFYQHTPVAFAYRLTFWWILYFVPFEYNFVAIKLQVQVRLRRFYFSTGFFPHAKRDLLFVRTDKSGWGVNAPSWLTMWSEAQNEFEIKTGLL
jgi:hypothetical protein